MFGKQSRHARERLEEHGKRARATVLEVASRGMAITTGSGQLVSDTEVALKLRLRVEPEGEPSFEVQTKMRFPQLARPRAGSQLAVIYDPEDPETIMRDESANAAIDLHMGGAPEGIRDIAKQVMAARSDGASMAELQGLAAQLGQRYAAGAGMTTSPAPAQDPLDRLEKLADLKAKGVLTEEEFQTQKARILGER